jgi:hypothetical protein
MAEWSGTITVTIDVDMFEADSQTEAEEYIEMNWTEYLHRSTVESLNVWEEEDEEEDTSIQGIEE